MSAEAEILPVFPQDKWGGGSRCKRLTEGYFPLHHRLTAAVPLPPCACGESGEDL